MMRSFTPLVRTQQLVSRVAQVPNKVRALSIVSRLGQNSYSKKTTPRHANTGLYVALGIGAAIGGYFYYDRSSKSSVNSSIDYAAVAKEIANVIEQAPANYDDGSFGPLLVRLAWHAAGTYDKTTGKGGSNGATMRFKSEASDGANNGLDIARGLMEKVKQKFPEISYADLWSLAGVIAIKEMGGPSVSWRPGRSDAASESACPPNGLLPDATRNQDHLRSIFYRQGFDDQEIVALSGAHALGRCHADRSGFIGPWTRAPTTFSNEYFRELVENKWTKKVNPNGSVQYADPTGDLMMLPTDLALLFDPNFKKYVITYAKDEAAFFKDFAKAFQKLLENGVKFPAGTKTYTF